MKSTNKPSAYWSSVRKFGDQSTSPRSLKIIMKLIGILRQERKLEIFSSFGVFFFLAMLYFASCFYLHALSHGPQHSLNWNEFVLTKQLKATNLNQSEQFKVTASFRQNLVCIIQYPFKLSTEKFAEQAEWYTRVRDTSSNLLRCVLG